MGAQRLTKILGIFARLDQRDGKPGYLQHIPRVRAYLDRALAHPALVRTALWFETFVFPRGAGGVTADESGREPFSRAPCCSPPGSARACAR